MNAVISTSAVDEYIDKNSRRFVDELKELCTFPSVSNDGADALKPARDWLGARRARFTDRVETLEAGGLPALYAEVPVWSGGEVPARSDPDSPVARTMIQCVQELYGEPILWRFMAATGPMHPVVADLGIPTVLPVGVGRPDNRVHAPNENIHVADYINTVRLMCRVWESFGAG